MRSNGHDDGVSVAQVAESLFGMIPGVGPPVGLLVGHLTRKMIEENERNTSEVLRLACQRAGLSREDLAEVLDRNPSAVTLVNRVLFAAAMNGQTSTVQLLAGFLAQALSEPESIDDIHLLLSPLGSLGEHHIRVLKCIAERDEEGDNSYIWNVTHLPGIVHIRSEFVLVAVQGLLAVGFAQSNGIDGGDLGVGGKPAGELISITALGRTVLDVLGAVLADEAAKGRD